MSKEKLISEIRGITNCSINGFYEAVKAVGSNKQNILDYLDIHGCAVVTKDKLTGIPISSTAIIINEKDKEIAELKAENKELLKMNEMFLNPKPLIEKLQQQLKEKDEEIERFKNKLTRYDMSKSEYQIENNKIVRHYALGGEKILNHYDIVDLLNAYDNEMCQYFTYQAVMTGKLEENTKQVCEKIRQNADGLWYFVLDEQKEHFEGNRYVLSRKDFDDILNLIEKGESK